MIVAIPEALREKLGPEGARALAELLNQIGREVREDVIVIAEEKFQRRLTEELGAVRGEVGGLDAGLREIMNGFRNDMAALEAGLRKDMTALETRLSDRMNRLETRLLRWNFAFWVGQFAVLLGILFAFFR